MYLAKDKRKFIGFHLIVRYYSIIIPTPPFGEGQQNMKIEHWNVYQ